jgi:hypothetical protein
MGIDIQKKSCSCDNEEGDSCCDCSCTGCKCTITIGGNNSKPGKTEFQKFIGHLANISWLLFMIAFIFSHNTFLIVAMLIAAIVFEEFD